MALNPQLAEALARQNVHIVTAVRIELPNRTLRLFDGSGTVLLAGEEFRGFEDLFGALDVIDSISEDIASVAPTVSISLSLPDPQAIAEVSQPGSGIAP